MGTLTAWAFAGQGSQHRGMGAAVFDRFADHCAAADAILGYSICDLCLEDRDGILHQTRHAQPAIYVVEALSMLVVDHGPPDFVVGHSVGEYAALLTAGCFDFETGLRLVQKRGELMARADGGGMLAVTGLDAEQITDILADAGTPELDIANYNLRQQVVLSGPWAPLRTASQAMRRAGGRCTELDVSAAFHSRYMAEAAEEFGEYLRSFRLEQPRIPVLSNVTAKPYTQDTIAGLLAKQIRAPVLWRDCMRHLLRHGVGTLREIGGSRVLTQMWRSECEAPPSPSSTSAGPVTRGTAEKLGSAEFCRDYGIRYAYLAGSMFRGISSVALVVRMAKAGLMGFLGTGGLTLDEIDSALSEIRRQLGRIDRFGANLLHNIDDPDAERATVRLYLRHDLHNIEASAYMQITPALVHFRFKGARMDGDGRPLAPRRIVTKVSRPELATAFMQPAPEEIIRLLVDEGSLSPAEAEVARRLPVSQDVCVESDSGGHSDARVALALMPVMTRLRNECMERYQYPARIRIGAAGGLGAPEGLAAAFVLGADFVVTGSVNQCSPEAGTSEAVKELLAKLDVHDTGYAPAGDMFEFGAKVQAVRKGTLFVARANQLYQLYRQQESLETIESRTRRSIEENWFRRSFNEIWRETCDHRVQTRPALSGQPDRPKQKMALVFRWYFAHSIRAALRGDLAERVNFQIHCGPAMGTFNRLVRGTELEDWHNRHVDTIADRLMHGAGELLRRSP